MTKMWGVVLLVAASACAGVTEPLPEPSSATLDANGEIVLARGDDVRLDGSVLRLTFTDVLADSRCPMDVTCVWAGDAEIQLGVTLGSGPTAPRVLHMNPSVGATTTEDGGFRITLVEVLPEARSTVPIRDADYSIRLKVESM